MMKAKEISLSPVDQQIEILAIIPARSGSKGILNKNIHLLAGKPLINYTIDAALRSKIISRCVVSTDSTAIADISRALGAETPFIRPDHLSTDMTNMNPVLCHALSWLEENEHYIPTHIVLLQPTSPFRTSTDIDEALNIMLENNADGIVSLCEGKHHPYHSKSILAGETLCDFLPLSILPSDPNSFHRRQDLPKAYALNGAIYAVKASIMSQNNTFYTDSTLAYVMPEERSLDIDTSWDLHIAELLMISQKNYS